MLWTAPGITNFNAFYSAMKITEPCMKCFAVTESKAPSKHLDFGYDKKPETDGQVSLPKLGRDFKDTPQAF